MMRVHHTAKPRLIVFMKAPMMGAAKTRLAADFGPVRAMRIYRMMCAKILRRVRDPRWETVLYLTPDNRISAEFNGLWPKHMDRATQGSGSLGRRIERCFDGPRLTVIIGTDTPDINVHDIAAAFRCLSRGKACFGPAQDGGFWLLGLAQGLAVGALDEVRWSHADTLTDTLAALRASGIDDVTVLRTLCDVDDGAAFAQVFDR